MNREFSGIDYGSAHRIIQPLVRAAILKVKSHRQTDLRRYLTWGTGRTEGH